MSPNELLPESLPTDPLPLFAAWMADARARRTQPNPDAMVVATVGADARPSARVVLCRTVDAQAGFVAFYTNYTSRKGRELATHPRAAAVIHWDFLHRQVRLEGPVVRSPPAESDAYFAHRGIGNRISAWASEQSQPLASHAALATKVAEYSARFGATSETTDAAIPRPPHWGGERLWIESIELWVEGPGRVHDRAVWTRALTPTDEFTFTGSAWRATRLNP